jgi:hypothetical protein
MHDKNIAHENDLVAPLKSSEALKVKNASPINEDSDM